MATRRPFSDCAFPNPRELSTERGARLLAQQLTNYWAARGQTYKFEHYLASRPSGKETIWGIRSNLKLRVKNG